MDGVVSLTLPGGSTPFFTRAHNVLLALLPGAVEGPRYELFPLVIWGPAGCGKTTLANGLIGSWRNSDATQKTRTLTGVDFARLYADAVDTDTLEEFRHSFRSCGLICVEQVHTLDAKPAAARELCYLLDTFQQQDQLVLCTSAVPPVQLSLAPLASRLNAGLVVPLSLPEETVLRAIFDHRLAGWSLVPDDSLSRLLFEKLQGHFQSDLTPRVLEGALHQLELVQRERRAMLSEELIAELFPVSSQGTKINVARICTVVAKHFRVTPGELRSSSRRQTLVQARGVVAILARELTDESLQTIGKELGNRDHSTVSHLLGKTAETLAEDFSLTAAVSELRQALLTEPGSGRTRRRRPGKRVASLSAGVAKSATRDDAQKLLF